MVRVGFHAEMDRAAGRGGVLSYMEGAFEFEDGVGVCCVGLWLRGGHFIVSDLRDGNEDVYGRWRVQSF